MSRSIASIALLILSVAGCNAHPLVGVNYNHYTGAADSDTGTDGGSTTFEDSAGTGGGTGGTTAGTDGDKTGGTTVEVTAGTSAGTSGAGSTGAGSAGGGDRPSVIPAICSRSAISGQIV